MKRLDRIDGVYAALLAALMTVTVALYLLVVPALI
jgi:hypothetical protein